MFKVLHDVQMMEKHGEHIIHFEIGDPDFSTPAHIIKAAAQSLDKSETHYTSSMGLYDLRAVAAETTLRSRGFRPDISQVLVTPGANIIIYLAVECLVNPGEEVIVPDPGFSTYYSVLKLCNAKPVRVPLREENEFRMNPDDILKAITPKTKLIIVNSPNNPTGSVMTKEELDRVYEIAKTHNLFLLSDEIYARMMYDGPTFYSPSIHDGCKERTVITNGFSKAFAMTGWRLGVAIGPSDIIEKMGLLVQTICSCVPPFIQRAGIAAIEGDQKPITHMMETYQKRRDVLVEGLNNIPGIHCLKPHGAFYVFPNITQTGMSSEEFADFALNHAKIALLPGTNFGVYGQGYVRLTYATDLKNILEGIKRLSSALERRNRT